MAISEVRIQRLSQDDGQQVVTPDELKELSSSYFWFMFNRGIERDKLSKELFVYGAGAVTAEQSFAKADRYFQELDRLQRELLA